MRHTGVMRIWAVTLLSCLALLAGCGDDSEPEASDPGTKSESTSETPSPTETVKTTATPETSAPPAAEGTTVVVEDSEFGPMLFDDTGQAIYLFDVETTAEPECYDDCAAAWPPVFTDGKPVAGDGVDASLLGTTERSDGRLQVTYNDHPLYFYAHEGKHEVLCHDVFLNGGNWYVVQPGGDAAPPG
jgi:predicted lipoprotein with Yx(FWY)xxD motif